MLLLGVALLFASAYLAAHALTTPARERRRALYAVVAATRPAEAAEQGEPFRRRVVEPLLRRLAALTLRVSPRTSSASVRQRLRAAGMQRWSPTSFLAAKAGGAALGVLLALMFFGSSSPGLGVLAAGIMGFAGFRGPDFIVSSRATKRAASVRVQLPDALDLLAVSVDAGLSFEAATSRLAEHLEGPLIDELSLALNEMRLGRPRDEAMRAIVERVDVPELGSFVRSTIQADQLGLSLTRVLRIQAEEARRRRQAIAEEKAMKAPVKMLFPTVIFIFPAMFVVILGPALLQFAKLFR